MISLKPLIASSNIGENIVYLTELVDYAFFSLMSPVATVVLEQWS